MRIKKSLLKLSLAPVLALALLGGACSDQSTPSGLTAPEQAAFAKGGVKKLRKLSLTNPAPMQVTAKVGANGGVLQADQYFLVIPAGAVKGETTFSMDVGSNGVVSLLATETRSDGSRADVGVVGFKKRLTLALYYGNAGEAITDAAKLQVGWVQSNGSLSPVAGRVDTSRKLVYGELNHFSAYAIIIPE